MNINDNIIQNIKNKTLNINDYEFSVDSDDSLTLTDHILLYNTGNTWKVIPILIALSYPIIYDKYSINDETYDITLVLCPVTLRCTMFKGIFEFITYQNYRMILKEKNDPNENLIPIDLGIKIDKKHILQTNRRSEVKISTLRSALVISPDPIFMITNKTIIPVINIDYYSNNIDINGNILDGLIHPKTLVYVIQYKSYSTGDEKISIVLGKDITKNEITGYDAKQSEIYDYLEKYKQKIINREGYIMPMLWYLAKDIYKSSRVVYIY